MKLSKIFSHSLSKSNLEEDEIKIKDNKPVEGLFYKDFNKDKKELNFNLPLKYENNKVENPFINLNESNNNFNTLSNKSSLFGDKDLFGNEGIKKGGFPLFNNASLPEIKKENDEKNIIIKEIPQTMKNNYSENLPLLKDIIEYDNQPIQEKAEKTNIFMNNINKDKDKNIFKCIYTDEKKQDNLKNNNNNNTQLNSNLFSTKDNTLNQENKEEFQKKNNNQIISAFTKNINKEEERITKIENPFLFSLSEKDNNKDEKKNNINSSNKSPFIYIENNNNEKENIFSNNDKNESSHNYLFNKEKVLNNNIIFSKTNESTSENPFESNFKKEENKENIEGGNKEIEQKEKKKNDNLEENNIILKIENPFLKIGNNIFNVENNNSLFNKNESNQIISSSLFSNQNNLQNIFLYTPNDIDINKKTFSIFEENDNKEKEITTSFDKKENENNNYINNISYEVKKELNKNNSINDSKENIKELTHKKENEKIIDDINENKEVSHNLEMLNPDQQISNEKSIQNELSLKDNSEFEIEKIINKEKTNEEKKNIKFDIVEDKKAKKKEIIEKEEKNNKKKEKENNIINVSFGFKGEPIPYQKLLNENIQFGFKTIDNNENNLNSTKAQNEEKVIELTVNNNKNDDEVHPSFDNNITLKKIIKEKEINELERPKENDNKIENNNKIELNKKKVGFSEKKEDNKNNINSGFSGEFNKIELPSLDKNITFREDKKEKDDEDNIENNKKVDNINNKNKIDDNEMDIEITKGQNKNKEKNDSKESKKENLIFVTNKIKNKSNEEKKSNIFNDKNKIKKKKKKIRKSQNQIYLIIYSKILSKSN